MKRILLVEDDKFLREALATQLTDAGFHITQAPEGRAARNIFGTEPFDLVISDIQMPFLDGVELLKWIKTKNATPVILLTGFTNLLDVQSAHELGAAEFFSKPFKVKDLILGINKLLSPGVVKPISAASLDSEYCKVSLEEFVSRAKIEFDVYIRLSEHKYVKIGQAGSEIPVERIRAYQAKGAQCLHILRKDYHKLVKIQPGLVQSRR